MPSIVGTAGAVPAFKRQRTAYRARSVPLQVLVVVLTVLFAGWIIHNAANNLAARHIASGFGFLTDAAGFAISEGFVPYDAQSSYLVAFAAGAANTLRAAVPAIIVASLIGLTLGVAQISRHALLRLIAKSVVDLLRNIPLLVQLLVWYIALLEFLPRVDSAYSWAGVIYLSNGGLAFAAPVLDGPHRIGLVVATIALFVGALFVPRHRLKASAAAAAVSAAIWLFIPSQWDVPQAGFFGISGGASISVEWLSLVAALSLYSGVYCAEIVRAGLMAVRRGQWEAAHALNLTRGQTLRKIIIPQSLRVIVPPYTSLVMNTLKNSSLAVAVGYPDIVSIGTTSLNQTGQAIECIAVIAAVYLSLNIITASIMGVINRRAQLRER
ncbi:ABC transporter permease subunit [Mesorhizobium sp. KR1-2]|uniref:amino acid ABC transporter permease n=1 Tax=Mesorhizobium sp. KR1-2 TaxID=3156609 RepID=UPI0032B35509